MSGLAAIARAKVNLALHVGAVRADGYHPVDTVCVFLDIGERVRVSARADAFDLTVSGPMADDLGTAGSQGNLILRGAQLMAAATKVPTVTFDLYKAAPVASGIGAGTADGVAAMALLNHLADRPLSREDMIALSIGLGADGPVCMANHLGLGRAIRARGIGEQISAGPKTPPAFLCLANPGMAVSTGAVFRHFDRQTSPGPFTVSWEGQGRAGFSDFSSWASSQRNDLRPSACALAPEIAKIEDAMTGRPGCSLARMSGSGATVFGLFPDAVSAQRAKVWFAGQGCWSVAGPLSAGGEGAGV